jgi:uncharacterized repeat protein (TIGR03943 family)
MSGVISRAGADRAAARPATTVWSASRVAGASVLAAWAALFWFLLVTGRHAFYLSTRTAWVVPVAAVLLSAGAVGRLAAARTSSPEPLGRREAVVMGVMVLPVVLIAFLPPATLGSFAAGKRSAFVATGAAASGDIGSGELTLVDIAAGQTTKEGERALAARAGEHVSFVGFVSRYDDTPADEFLLTRYVVTCCVADATPAQVRVVNVPAGAFETNEWVRVDGTIYPVGREVIVDADPSGIQTAPRPSRPYLTA